MYQALFRVLADNAMLWFTRDHLERERILGKR